MEKAFRKGSLMKFINTYFQSKCHGAHIFQLKDDVPASAGGGTMWLSMGGPRNAPYLPYYGNILNTYQAYQELGIIQ